MTSTQPIVVGLGELLWDLFPDSKRPGGAPANVAFQANQLGCEGRVCSRVGNEKLGTELLDFCKSQDLSTEYIQIDEEHPTGKVTVDMNDAGHPEYIIHENVAWDYLEMTDATKTLMQQAAAVCFGSLGQRSLTSHQTIQQCLEAVSEKCLIVFDVNLRQQWYSKIVIEASLQHANILKLNAEEILVIARLSELSGDSPEAIADSILKQYPVQTVCITRAEKGCLVIQKDQTVDIPGRKVDVADAVGAGDAFTAALIMTQLEGWNLKQAATFANQVGGMVASRSGAMPNLQQEFAALKAEFRA